MCKSLGHESHPARFPVDLPKFFINFLTDPGDLVVDIFSGSNTAGAVAESLGRRWLSIELDRAYAELSAIRFMEDWSELDVKAVLEKLSHGSEEIHPTSQLPLLVLQNNR
jgi:site-specific DNA-methyltransferase (cytosine-N4-specific)